MISKHPQNSNNNANQQTTVLITVFKISGCLFIHKAHLHNDIVFDNNGFTRGINSIQCLGFECHLLNGKPKAQFFLSQFG